MYGSTDFMNDALSAVYDIAKDTFDPTDDVKFTQNDVYVVTYSYILGCHKAMISTNLLDGKYYEVTYNKDTHEMYIDTYVKAFQKVLIKE